jgi:hypothetical protein
MIRGSRRASLERGFPPLPPDRRTTLKSRLSGQSFAVLVLTLYGEVKVWGCFLVNMKRDWEVIFPFEEK